MTEGPGGLSAFLDRFRKAGLGTELTSFLGGSSDAQLPAKSVNTVVGETNVMRLAQRVGVAPAAATTALGFEIPRLIGMLTPGGKVSSALPNEVQAFVGRREQVSPEAIAVLRDDEQVPPVAMAKLREERPNLTWLWALLALGLIGALLWGLLSRNRAPRVQTSVPPVATTVTAPAVPTPTVRPPAAVTNTVTALNQELTRTVLNFPTDSAQLPAASQAQLRQAAARLQSLPAGSVIEIGGHTDSVGDDAYNLDLSQRRADAVRTALIQDGAAPAKLVARGYGETRPIASNDTSEGRYQNRRTSFTAVGETNRTTTTTVDRDPTR